MIFLLLLLTSVVYADIGYMLQITDIHYDPEYVDNSPNNCVIGSKLGTGCCRIRSIPLEPWSPASYWGDYNCDTPQSLIESTFIWINKTLPKIDIILWTGDTINHHDFTQSIDEDYKILETIQIYFNKYFPFSLMVQMFGNHDTWPVDQFNSKIPMYSKYVNKVMNLWNKTNNIGFYSINIQNVKIIVLNCLLWDSNNLLFNKHDADLQWNWLIRELNGSFGTMPIWVTGHIAPGSVEFSPIYNDRFISLLSKYSNIKHTFWGHSHKDEFILLRDNQVYNYGFISPSLMSDKHYPAFRLYFYNKTDYSIIDYNQYALNLTKLIEDNKFEYYLYYSMRSGYGLNDLSLNSIYKLILNITDDDKYFNLYYSRMYVDYIHPKCDTLCKKQIKCSILYSKVEDILKCNE